MVNATIANDWRLWSLELSKSINKTWLITSIIILIILAIIIFYTEKKLEDEFGEMYHS